MSISYRNNYAITITILNSMKCNSYFTWQQIVSFAEHVEGLPLLPQIRLHRHDRVVHIRIDRATVQVQLRGQDHVATPWERLQDLAQTSAKGWSYVCMYWRMTNKDGDIEIIIILITFMWTWQTQGTIKQSSNLGYLRRSSTDSSMLLTFVLSDFQCLDQIQARLLLGIHHTLPTETTCSRSSSDSSDDSEVSANDGVL